MFFSISDANINEKNRNLYYKIEFYPAVVIFEYLKAVITLFCKQVCAFLAHSDAVSVAVARKSVSGFRFFNFKCVGTQ